MGGVETVVNRWHDAVNGGGVEPALVVTDPVVVLGPRGAGAITAEAFAEWVERSGIRLAARSWHPVGERLMVVEQEARWPGDEEATRVATVFRVSGDRVSAALRLPDLRSALELASIYRELAATE